MTNFRANINLVLRSEKRKKLQKQPNSANTHIIEVEGNNRDFVQHVLYLASQVYLEYASAEADEESLYEICNEIISTFEDEYPAAIGNDFELNILPISFIVKNRRKLKLTVSIDTEVL